jgi:hypothetical protein
MGNGGGGTVIFGMTEQNGETDGLPDSVSALPDPSVIGVLEDVIRAGIRPPLLTDLRLITTAGGLVLVVDVLRSPLGPYMVDSYGDRRYYVRDGTRTAPMGEQQIRDAYLLAARGRERRGEAWTDHALPMAPPGDTPWLSISGLPEEPLVDLLDVWAVTPTDVKPPESLASLLAVSGLEIVVLRLGRWADGLFGHDGHDGHDPSSSIRLGRGRRRHVCNGDGHRGGLSRRLFAVTAAHRPARACPRTRGHAVPARRRGRGPNTDRQMVHSFAARATERRLDGTAVGNARRERATPLPGMDTVSGTRVTAGRAAGIDR